MSIRRKGSRAITVDGVSYRWRIRKRVTYCQLAFGCALTVSIESVDSPQCVLLVTLDESHPSNWFGQTHKCVTPKDVANHIRAALESGWEPASDGAPFRLNVIAERATTTSSSTSSHVATGTDTPTNGTSTIGDVKIIPAHSGAHELMINWYVEAFPAVEWIDFLRTLGFRRPEDVTRSTWDSHGATVTVTENRMSKTPDLNGIIPNWQFSVASRNSNPPEGLVQHYAIPLFAMRLWANVTVTDHLQAIQFFGADEFAVFATDTVRATYTLDELLERQLLAPSGAIEFLL